jgi:CO/xanthine dehydrogenase FAD-binding subunit
MALDAQVKLMSSNGERVMPVGKLYTGDGKEPLAIEPGEILSEISIPRPSGRQSSVYMKYRVRDAIDFPLAGVAVRMDSREEGVCTDCRIVMSALGSAPVEVNAAQNLLKGEKPTADLLKQAAERAAKGAHPVANLAGSTPAYRRKMVEILTRSALSATANALGFRL